jgi:hypothetical protein
MMDFAGFFLTSFLASLDFAITASCVNEYDNGNNAKAPPKDGIENHSNQHTIGLLVAPRFRQYRSAPKPYASECAFLG